MTSCNMLFVVKFCLKPSKLIRHLETKDASVQNKPLQQQIAINKSSCKETVALKAFYLVALRVARE